MNNSNTKELVFGTFVDMNTRSVSKLNGSEVCFVLATEDFDSFIERSQNKNYKDIAILMRYPVSESFAEEYLELIEDYKVPNNQRWFYSSQLKESIDSFGKTTNYKARLYKSKKDKKYMHLEGRKYKTPTK